jgi:DNA repair exonuclease SbcCD ATPase subunit
MEAEISVLKTIYENQASKLNEISGLLHKLVDSFGEYKDHTHKDLDDRILKSEKDIGNMFGMHRGHQLEIVETNKGFEKLIHEQELVNSKQESEIKNLSDKISTLEQDKKIEEREKKGRFWAAIVPGALALIGFIWSLIQSQISN